MFNRRVFLSFLAGLTALTLNSNVCMAQDSAESIRIVGYSGAVRVVPNVERREVTIELALAGTEYGKSDQIVFHLQSAGSSAPSSWNGAARVLAGDGVVAVLPNDKSRGFLFKFLERPRPSSFERMSFDEYPVFGIARFGENKRLTPEQIRSLEITGRVGQGSDAFDPARARPNALDIAGNSPHPEHEGPTNCVAGGEGSSSCGAGGCTVTCSSGYFACCQGGTCLCQKNP